MSILGSLRIEAAEESDQVNRENNFLNLILKHIFQGKYECVATNSVGTEYSYSAQLYVRGMWEQKLHLFPGEYYQNFLQFVECRHTSPSDLRQSMK